MRYNLNRLRGVLRDSKEVAAAYLFGSAARGGAVVNDLDLLLLLYPGFDAHMAYFNLLYRISSAMGLPEDQIDLLFFDVEEADPLILYEAVNEGILIKNESPGMLCERIEELSLFFLANEFLLKQASQLRRERLEEFCAGKSRAN